MRYGDDRKRQTRERIIKAAAKQVRERGVREIALASVMAEVGLTHGGFYAHFTSKEEFLEEVVEEMFVNSPVAILIGRPEQPPRQIISEFLAYYLSPEHRDTVTGGCPLPFLANDAPHLSQLIHEKLMLGIDTMTNLVAGHIMALGLTDPETQAASCVSEVIGALILSRAQSDRTRSDAILTRSHSSLLRRLGQELRQCCSSP